MRDIWFLQSWDINETAELLHNMNEGFDETPKLRLIPKNIPNFSKAQTVLATISGIGKVTSANLLVKHGTIEEIIKQVKKIPKKERSTINQNLYDAFCIKPKKVIK